MQFIQLQEAKARFEDKGIRVASITYDSEEILKEFSVRKSVTYPMLSDTGSKIIRSFGILNPDGKGFAAGIPYPGIYSNSPKGKVERRFFEAQSLIGIEACSGAYFLGQTIRSQSHNEKPIPAKATFV
jgi:hypothetical protein